MRDPYSDKDVITLSGGSTARAIVNAVGAITAIVVTAAPAYAQQAKPKMSVEERIGKTVGPIIVRASLLEGANEELQTIVEQRDKTIADLQAQIAELKKPKPPE